MTRRSHLLPWLIAALLAGCSSPGLNLPEIGERLPEEVRDVLEGAEHLELLVLHPDPEAASDAPGGEAEIFHGHRILGRVGLSELSDRRDLLTLLYRGLLDSDGLRASCFRPRHGIRADLDEERIDVVLCFECLWMKVLGPVSSTDERVVLTGEGVRAEFDALCRRFGLRPHP